MFLEVGAVDVGVLIDEYPGSDRGSGDEFDVAVRVAVDARGSGWRRVSRRVEHDDFSVGRDCPQARDEQLGRREMMAWLERLVEARASNRMVQRLAAIWSS